MDETGCGTFAEESKVRFLAKVDLVLIKWKTWIKAK